MITRRQAGGRVLEGAPGPVPSEWRRAPPVQMEPSRKGAANACRVVRAPPPAPAWAPGAKEDLYVLGGIRGADELQIGEPLPQQRCQSALVEGAWAYRYPAKVSRRCACANGIAS